PVYVAVCDVAGNFAQATDTIGLDTIAPSVSLSINGGAAWTNDANVSLGVTATDTGGSGVANYSFSQTDPADTCPRATSGNPTGANPFTLTGADDAAKPVYVA